MRIYKFRILLEDNDQFFREIDIAPNQTFEEFHKVIATSAGFDLSEMASFYICDSNWKKQQELSLCDLGSNEEEEPEYDDVRQIKKKVLPVSMMCNTKLKDTINDPHQRILYIYDFLKMHTFLIELFKIVEADEKVKYPVVVKSTGLIAKPPVPISDEEADAEDEITDEIEDDDEPSTEELLDGLYDDKL